MTTPVMHQQTARQIERILDSPPHAIGLCGDGGAGKGYLANYISAKILDISEISEHPYVLHLDVVQDKAGIEEVRKAQNFLTLTVPGNNTFKRVVIIEYIDKLGHEAQNALLKTLEEPPTDTVIVVTFQRETDILPTINSRLQTVSVLPVDQSAAKGMFSSKDATEFTKAFYLSGGQMGLLHALLDNESEHPLQQAIVLAKSVISESRYKRLAMVDSLVKNSVSPQLMLDGLYRLMNASYQQSLKTKTTAELKPMVHRLTLIESAIADLDQKVQAKLVLNRLFLEL